MEIFCLQLTIYDFFRITLIFLFEDSLFVSAEKRKNTATIIV